MVEARSDLGGFHLNVQEKRTLGDKIVENK